MELLDSRRLTGPGLLLDGPGAVIDAAAPPAEAGALAAAWSERIRRVLDALGWAGAQVAAQVHAGGASLAFAAPPDALYAATEVNEWAFDAAVAAVRGEPEPPLAEAAERLRARVDAERSPRLLALRAAAARAGVAFLPDDDTVSVGMGGGSLAWPVDALPDADAVDWARVRDVPTALVTGTNGKTTTVRLVAAMAAAAGRAAGFASTDEVVVGGRVVDRGDFSGPMGARQVLRDPGVEMAVLETARGGILRRGLVIAQADVALVTNVSADHLGEFGVYDMDALAAAKLLVARAVRPGGRVVLNAEDPVLVAAAPTLRSAITWFAMDRSAPKVREAVMEGARAVFVENGKFVLAHGAERIPLGFVAEAPVTMGGAARHNVANALAAIGVADALGLGERAIAAGLRSFGTAPGENAGRGEVLELGGAKVLVDFAHNPAAVAALVHMAAAIPADRRLVLLGQAGDRDDDAIRDLVRSASALMPDRVVVKEMLGLLRGRQPGEIPALVRDELLRDGVPDDAIDFYAPTELDGVRRALAWVRAGDLLVLPIHKQRPAVEALLAQLRGTGWTAGDPLPEPAPD
ncbi:MAG: mur ligase family peptide synthase [Gemmatimonadetes bacterium]|nr:mur ligase family peptide synthase [Gemmatimonadota bacterium]